MSNIKHPLLVIDSDGDIRRIQQYEPSEKKTLIQRLRCCRLDRYCTVNCIAIKLFDKNNILGLICIANIPIMIGILDLEKIDLDLIESLRWGTVIQKTFENSKK
jgi:hypothetical protein